MGGGGKRRIRSSRPHETLSKHVKIKKLNRQLYGMHL